MKIFSTLSDKELSLFIPFLYEREYNENEVVFFRNDPAKALYIVMEGKIQVNVDLRENVEKLAYISAGQAFGESCILPNKTRVAHAIVVSDGALLQVIPQVSIFDIFEDSIEIKVKMMEQMADIYHEINRNMINSYKNSSGFFHLADVYND